MRDSIIFRSTPALALYLVAFLAAVPAARPSAAQITVRGDLAHDLDAAPGSSLTGRIEVFNESGEMQEVRAYLRDYSFDADGSNSYDEPGTNPRSNAPWITFSPRTAVVPAGEAIEVGYRIDVPTSLDALSGTGSYWSILMVETVDPSSSESSLSNAETTTPAVGFRQITRYGVQLATHIGEGAPVVQFEGVRLSTDDAGTVTFSADILNTGTGMIRPDVYVRLFDSSGSESGPFDGVRFRIYPGTSVRQRITLEGVPPGDYSALLIVDGGGDDVFGGQYELTL